MQILIKLAPLAVPSVYWLPWPPLWVKKILGGFWHLSQIMFDELPKSTKNSTKIPTTITTTQTTTTTTTTTESTSDMTGGGTVLAEFRILDASLKEFFNK